LPRATPFYVPDWELLATAVPPLAILRTGFPKGTFADLHGARRSLGPRIRHWTGPGFRDSLLREMKYRTILLFGAPGAGKGTQGKILGSIPQFFHCACGDVFRNLKPDNELGRIFLQYSSRGQLVPDEATVELWRHSLEGNRRSGRFNPERDALVLDGIPRNAAQAQMLQEAIDVQAIINLVCPDPNKLIERLQRRALHENRLDDASLDVIRSRLETYERQTKAVLDFYGPERIAPVDATQTPVCVLRDILNILSKLPVAS
jgi:adenylate kinase